MGMTKNPLIVRLMALQHQLKGCDLCLHGSPQGGVPWQLNTVRWSIDVYISRYFEVHGGACMHEDIHMSNSK